MNIITQNSYKTIDDIGIALCNAKKYERVVLLSNHLEHSYYLEHSYHPFLQRIPDILNKLFPSNYKDQNLETIACLYRIFGEEKVIKVSNQFDLKIEYKFSHGLPITVGDIEKIFAGCAIIYCEEMGNFFENIKKIKETDIFCHLNSEEIKKLKIDLSISSEKVFHNLTNEELKKLYAAMLPFKKIENIFLGKIPKGEFESSCNPKKNFVDWQRFVYSYLNAREKMIKGIDENKNNKNEKMKYKDGYILHFLKKLLNYNLVDHSSKNRFSKIIFDFPKGLLYWHQKMEKNGAYAIALKAIRPEPENKFLSKICFLPTQCLNEVPQPWESMVDDACEEIGAEGAKGIYADINSLFSTSAGENFLKEDEKVDLMGYSLGGNQASRTFILLYPKNRVRKLLITSNPGLEKGSLEVFKKLTEQYKHKVKISIFSEWDDHVTRYGDGQLGLNCDKDIVNIDVKILETKGRGSKEYEFKDYSEYELLNFPEKDKCFINVLGMAALLFRSLNDGHSRESYNFKNLKIHRIRNYLKKEESSAKKETLEFKQKFLNQEILDNTKFGWENKRKEIIKLFHNIIIQFFNKINNFFDYSKKSITSYEGFIVNDIIRNYRFKYFVEFINHHTKETRFS